MKADGKTVLEEDPLDPQRDEYVGPEANEAWTVQGTTVTLSNDGQSSLQDEPQNHWSDRVWTRRPPLPRVRGRPGKHLPTEQEHRGRCGFFRTVLV